MTEKLAIAGGPPAVRRPLQPFNSIAAAEREAALRFLDRGAPLSGFHGSARPTFFGGDEVLAFEKEWCARFGAAHAISMNSATSGLIAALGAVGIGPGDEVIVPPYSMSASAIAPVFYGGVPVFADIDPDYFCIDYDCVVKAITPHTRAIIAVNLFGHPAELKKLRALADARGLYLIEDSAQATLATEYGKPVGTVGHIGVYSLNIHKHIQTGEGGVCVTADAELAKRLQLIRNHGENVVDWMGMTDLTNLVGFNFRMTELGAAMARVQLSRIEELVERVEKIAGRLSEGLSNLKGVTTPAVRANCSHNYYMWSVKIDAAVLGASREAFSKALAAEGFPTATGYVPPIYWLAMFQKRIAIGREGFPFTLRDRHYPMGLCPVAERMHNSELLQYQPVSWSADDEQVEMLIEAFRKVHSNASTVNPGVGSRSDRG
jgi:perosamine synthetase